MAVGRLGRTLMGPVLVVDLLVFLILITLASCSLNIYIDAHQIHPHLGGNSATNYMLMFALLGGATGAASIIVGFAHYRAWSVESMTAAASAATISWAVMALAFGLAWKEFRLGGRRGKRLESLEVLIVTSTLIHLFYIMLLHAGTVNERYGLCYGGRELEGVGEGPGPVSEAQKSTGPEPEPEPEPEPVAPAGA